MRFFIFFLLLFFLELGGFVLFSESFGFLTLVLEIILSGVLGVFLLFNTLSGNTESILELLRQARDPKEILASNIAKVFGAILLIVPGIFSDCLGLLFYFGLLDSVFVLLLGKASIKKYSKTSTQEEIIDVEIIQEHRGIRDEETHNRK